MRRVSRVVDVGANDGYFTFGSAAAFRRLAKTGEIIACEPRELFAEQGLRLVQVSQRPMPLLGHETREEKNWWLVSDVSVSA